MEDEKRPRPFGRHAAQVAVSAMLAAGLMGAPSAASAEEVAEGGIEQFLPSADSTSIGEDVFGWASPAPAANALSADTLPETFDLRNNDKFDDVVTPVKFQNPWGTCWSFGVVAASETSILSEAAQKGIALPDEAKDLSERHLAWFTYTPLLPDDDSGQGGEGMVSLKEGSARLDSGGTSVFGTSLFSSGIGPVPESEVPYRGKAGKIETKKDDQGNEYPYHYSADDDWSVDEEYRFQQMVEFEESVQLPSPGEYNATAGDEMAAGEYESAAKSYENAERANDAIKQQLYEGRGVAIAFCADKSKPEQVTEAGYMNPGNNKDKSWAHYTHDKVPNTHAVTIVGWDDNYAKENFGNPDPKTGEVDPATRPHADGAWIVKNSWGSYGEFPNGHPEGWGTDENGDGHGDGYFYLSYWDKTISNPEAFDFSVESVQSEAEYYLAHQYDYMPSSSVFSSGSSYPRSMANVFEAGETEEIRKLTCETTRPNTQVTFEAYLLDEGATLPTEGQKLVTVERTFDWGGFHTVELADDQAFTLDAGDRFSVVVTQRCLDDGKTYISWDIGVGKDALEQAQGSEEAAQVALPSYYSEGVVNEGESFLYGFADGGENSGWMDFSEVSAVLQESGYEADNPPIKAYGYPVEEGGDDPATEQDIGRLEDAIKDARNDLAQTVVSADGSDVAKGTPWVTQAAHDAFEAAIASAETAVGAERPLAGDIERAAADLAAAREAFDAAKADGLKETGGSGGSGGGSEEKPDAGSDAKGDGALVRTGDDATLGIAVVCAGGLSALAAGVALAMRRRIGRE